MNMPATLIFALPLALLAGLPSSRQQDAPTAKASQLTLEAKSYSVTTLIDLSAEFLGRNYLIQPSQANCSPESQMIRLQNPLSLGKEDCESAVSQLLSIYGWELSPLDPTLGIYEWVNLRSNNGINTSRRLGLSPEEVLAQAKRRIQVTTTLFLKYLDPDTISHRINTNNQNQTNRVQVSPLTNYRANGDSVTVGGIVLISGMCDQVAQTLRFLQEADQERNRAADSLEAQLRKLKARVLTLEGAAAHRK